jgi:hypothetical protein
MVLVAAPNYPGAKNQMLTSRSIRRDPSLLHAPPMQAMRSSFNHLAAARQAARSHITTIAERLSMTGTPSDGSPSGEREEELRRMLNTALTSLGALGDIYEKREARWREEMRRIQDDRTTVEMLLQQALGFSMPQTPIGNGTFGLQPAL